MNARVQHSVDQGTAAGMQDIGQLIDTRPLTGFQIRVILLCCLSHTDAMAAT